MSSPTEFVLPLLHNRRAHRQERRLTRYAMTRAEAAERFPDAKPDLRTREVRLLPDELRGNTGPAGPA